MCSIFENVPMGPKDPMFDLQIETRSDDSARKVDLGAGVYRDEEGDYYELPIIAKAKKILDELKLGHDYERTTGSPEFLHLARELLFGSSVSNRIASVQTIGGTGANNLGAIFLRKFYKQSSGRVFIGTPAWGNYQPLFTLAGFTTETYSYYNTQTKQINFEVMLETVSKAPRHSIFVLQACCHNPTGIDMSPEQWRRLAAAMKKAEQFPFLDIAYQGFGHGLDQDAYGVRYFADQGFESVVCQSFSKNMGLYGERVGALHVVVKDARTATHVHDQLRCLIRWSFSSSPAYGSRLATLVMSSDSRDEWREQLDNMWLRLEHNRAELHRLLTQQYQTPGNWHHIVREKGLFSYLTLTVQQIHRLKTDFHIYLPDTGRINVAGLGPTTIDIVARALDSVIRESSLRSEILALM